MSQIPEPNSVLLVAAGDTALIAVWAGGLAAALLLVTAADWALPRLARVVVLRWRREAPPQEQDPVTADPLDWFARSDP